LTPEVSPAKVMERSSMWFLGTVLHTPDVVAV